MNKLVLVLTAVIACSALNAGCEDDPTDKDYLKDSGTAGAGGSGGTGSDAGGKGNGTGGKASGSGGMGSGMGAGGAPAETDGGDNDGG